MDYSSLGRKVREKRQLLGLTQEKLAELCNISPSYVGIIERGDKKLSVETLLKLSCTLGISTDYLLKYSLRISSENIQIQEILNSLSKLEERDVKMVVDVVKAISNHKTKK